MKILVVGGGVSGLAFSVLTKKYLPETEILLIEKANEWKNIGFIMTLWPNGQRILKTLNLYDWVLTHGKAINGYNIANAQGKTLKDISFGELNKRFGQIVSIERAALHQKLQETAGAIPKKFGVTITSITESDSCATVELSDGTVDTYDLIVGADGVHSQIRQYLLGKDATEYINWAAWMTYVPQIQEAQSHVIHLMGNKKMFSIGPSPNNFSCVLFFLPVHHGIPDTPENRINFLREKFKDFGSVVPNVLQSLQDPQLMYHDDLRRIKIHKWFKGRTVIIGDAEHALSPTLGMGSSFAFEDAATLATMLQHMKTKGLSLAETLHSFVKLRQPPIDTIVKHDQMLWSLINAETSPLSTIVEFLLLLTSAKFFINPIASILTTQPAIAPATVPAMGD